MVGITVICLLVSSSLTAQNNSLLNELESQAQNDDQEVLSIFKSNRLILTQSTEQLRKKELQFRVSHLFGRISDGLEELYGLDQMFNVDLALEYGVSDKLSYALARSNDFDKTVQNTIKLALLQQRTDKHPPLSIAYSFGVNIKTKSYDDSRSFSDRLEYANQVILAKRFKSFSAMLSPTFVYVNRVHEQEMPHSIFSTVFGISVDISPSATINTEYVYIWPTFDAPFYDAGRNPLSLGIDLDTGGHVFQIFITNSTRLQTSGLSYNWDNDNFFDGDIHIGFSIMRSFDL